MANSSKACKYCKKYFLVSGMVKNQQGVFCSKTHVEEWLQLQYHKKQFGGKKSTGSNALVKPVKSRRKLQSEMVVQFNKVRRSQELIHFARMQMVPTCISCSCNVDAQNISNGHFITMASSSNLCIDPMNSYIQCKECNVARSGNIDGSGSTHGYKAGLLKRFGVDQGQVIIKYCEDNRRGEERSISEIKKLTRKFRKDARNLKIELSML